MAGWTNFPVAEGDNLHALTLYEQIVEAFNERLTVIQVPTPFALLDTPAVGDAHPQSRSWWAAIQNTLNALVDNSLYSLEKPTMGITPVGHWIRPYSDKSGAAYNPDTASGIDSFIYDLAAWRTDAGIPADGFTRRYPREIASTGDAGSLGQRAYLEGFNGVYEHNGTTWVLASDQTISVDILEAYGIAQDGDYLGPWLFNEIYNGLNRIIHFAEASGDGSDGSTTRKYKTSGFQSNATLAGLDADIAAAWAAATETTLATNDVIFTGRYLFNNDTEYFGDAESIRLLFDNETPTGYTADIDLYIASFELRPSVGSRWTFDDDYEYDASADYANAANYTFQRISQDTAITGTFSLEMNPPSLPPGPVTTPAIGELTWRGARSEGLFSADAHVAIVFKFNRAGGFTYY